MRIYKYMKKQHARLLLEKGCLRLGTLYEYRSTEIHGSAIGDETEGVKYRRLHVVQDHWDSSTIPEFAKSIFKLGYGPGITLSNVSFIAREQSENCFLFCASSVFDPAAMSAFGYDACVVIEHSDRFFSAVSHAFRHHGSFEGAAACQYVSRVVPHNRDHGVHPALIKDSRYAYQKEVRAFWRPFATEIEPRIVECRKASKWCSTLKGF